MNLNPGTLLANGRYTVKAVLGQGGFGITYLGEQTGLGRKVAIKEFFMDDFCDRDAVSSAVSSATKSGTSVIERFKEKFIKEARLIATFSNNHIIKIHDVFEENGTAYYVMEFLEGKSLKDIVEEFGPLCEDEALYYIRQVADALFEVHNAKMLHLDVKPANIMLNKKSEAVLIDFGISKRYDEGGGQTSATPVGVSAGYTPVEQYVQGGIDNFSPSTDIYSLAATLYFLLAGKVPPEASVVQEDGLPPLPSTVSQATVETITRTMCCRRRERPQSIPEFLALLDNYATAPVPVEEEPAAVDGDAVETVAAQPAVAAVQETAVPVVEKSAPAGRNSAVGDVKKNSGTVVKIVLAVVASLAITFALIFFMPTGGEYSLITTPEEEFDKALALLNSKKAAEARRGVALMDSLAAADYVPAMDELAHTYGWCSDSLSLSRKKVLGIAYHTSGGVKYMPKLDKYNDKARELYAKLLESESVEVMDKKANAAFRLATYSANKNGSYGRDYVKALEYLKIARKYAVAANEDSIIRVVDASMSAVEKKIAAEAEKDYKFNN